MLVSTHYMDEAERCHRISYISYGQMLATRHGRGGRARLRPVDLHRPRAAEPPRSTSASRALDGVEQVAPFGATLHVGGANARAHGGVARAASRSEPGLSVEPGATSLEDVFIHFMAAGAERRSARAA